MSVSLSSEQEVGVHVVGGAGVDVLVSGVPRLPSREQGRDEFTEQSLAALESPPLLTIGGNAGNAAYALARLGVRVDVVAAFGRDPLGMLARQWLESAGCAVRAVLPERTSVNVVAVDEAGGRVSFFYPVLADSAAALTQLERTAFRPGDVIFLAGYPHLADDVLLAWAERAHAAGATVALDFGPRLAGFDRDGVARLVPYLGTLLCNEDELIGVDPAADPQQLARELATDVEVVVKRGAAGATLYRGEREFHVSAFPVAAAVSVGAGDVFNAGFIWAGLAGLRDPEAKLRHAAAAAALMLTRGCGAIGAPDAAAVRTFLRDISMSEQKGTTMSTLPRWAQQLKDRHPSATMPTRENPIPPWLAQETKQEPLWYLIREAREVRTEHPFVLYDEIHRQPGQWSEIVAGSDGAVEKIADAVAERGVTRIITTGCGSALFTAMHGEFVMPRLSGLPTTAIESYELTHYFPEVDPAGTLVIGHSGTGGSIETVQAMEDAGRRGCLTLALTNTENTAVGRASELELTYVTRQECGPCISVVSTRALLATMLAIAIAQRTRRDSAVLTASRAALSEVADVGHDFLTREEPRIAQLAGQFKHATSWMLIGSGPHYFSAREGTLKIEEQANLIGKALRPGDFHHDALSVLAPDRPVVAIEAEGAANDRIVDALRAAREGRSPTVAVTWTDAPGARALAAAADHHVSLRPGLPGLLSPIPVTLVFQLLGYHLAVERGRNPDTLMTDHEPNTRAWLTSFPLGTH